jgi:hypothetical protein
MECINAKSSDRWRKDRGDGKGRGGMGKQVVVYDGVWWGGTRGGGRVYS